MLVTSDCTHDDFMFDLSMNFLALITFSFPVSFKTQVANYEVTFSPYIRSREPLFFVVQHLCNVATHCGTSGSDNSGRFLCRTFTYLSAKCY